MDFEIVLKIEENKPLIIKFKWGKITFKSFQKILYILHNHNKYASTDIVVFALMDVLIITVF